MKQVGGDGDDPTLDGHQGGEDYDGHDEGLSASELDGRQGPKVEQADDGRADGHNGPQRGDGDGVQVRRQGNTQDKYGVENKTCLYLHYAADTAGYIVSRRDLRRSVVTRLHQRPSINHRGVQWGGGGAGQGPF